MSQPIETHRTGRRRKPKGRPLVPSLFMCACAAALLSACATKPVDPSNFTNADLLGVVYDGHAQPVEGFAIVLDGKTSVYSDVNGRFTLPSVTRGAHAVEAKKTGYDALSMSFDYLQRTQFLYLSANSLSDYLSDAETALEKHDYASVRSLLDGAFRIDAVNPLALYMSALMDENLGNYEPAMTVLDTLLSQGVKTEAVYLLRIDVASHNPEVLEKVRKEIEGDPLVSANPRIEAKLKALSPGSSDKDK